MSQRMEFYPESRSRTDYLRRTPRLDYDDPLLRAKAAELFYGCRTPAEKVAAAFTFVRDEIAHSWDIRSSRVTKTAVETLKYKEGICYAKSMLLAALLRGAGIPAGFCYQRLTLGDTPETGYCVHALNAVYLDTVGRFVRIDARGNTGAINAQFDPGHPCDEQLAFLVRPLYGERNYPLICADPLPVTLKALDAATDCAELMRHLPTALQCGNFT